MMRKLLAHILQIKEQERGKDREGGREGNNLAFEGSRKKSCMYFWCTIFEMRSVNIHKKGKYKT